MFHGGAPLEAGQPGRSYAGALGRMKFGGNGSIGEEERGGGD
jgi:hypothetical protein